MIEKKWAAVPPVQFTVSGTKTGRITVTSTAKFRVKMEVAVNHPTLPTLVLEVKRVLSPTQMELGPVDQKLSAREDLTAYDIQTVVYADEQERPTIPAGEIDRATFEEEPVVARRVLQVDQFGRPYQTDNPVPVRLTDGNINVDTMNAQIEVHLDHRDLSDDPHDSLRIGDGTEELAINTNNEALVHDQDTHNRLDALHDMTKIESDATQTLLQSEFNETQTKLDEVKTEVDSSNYTMNETFNKAQAVAGQLDDSGPVVATEGNVAPVRITPQRAMHINLRDQSGNELIGRKTGTNAIPVHESEDQTYSCAVFNLIPAASATDLFTITGSATRTVRIKRITVSGTRTTHTWTDVILLRRSTSNTGGTSTAPTIASHDLNNAPATAVCRAYTANPTALGTSVGNLRAGNFSMPVAVPTNAQGNGPGHRLEWLFGENGGQPVVLRGVSQSIAINLNGQTVSGGAFHISVEWTEE
jgi:hypothetical protein